MALVVSKTPTMVCPSLRAKSISIFSAVVCTALLRASVHFYVTRISRIDTRAILVGAHTYISIGFSFSLSHFDTPLEDIRDVGVVFPERVAVTFREHEGRGNTLCQRLASLAEAIPLCVIDTFHYCKRCATLNHSTRDSDTRCLGHS